MNYDAVYTEMHERNPKHFSGFSIKPYVGKIGEMIENWSDRLSYWDGSRTPRLLDYGSGKGYQYLAMRVHEQWPGAPLPHCYDPGVRQLREVPKGMFDGIICTDVLEHIEEKDVEPTLAHIFGRAADNAFVFFVIACRAAKSKRLPDGRNVHVTVKPPEWWETKMAPFRRQGLDLRVEFDGG